MTEAAEPDLLNRPPQTIAAFLNWSIVRGIARNGIVLVAPILAVYLWIYYRLPDLTLARTAAFVGWLLGHILLALNVKQDRLPLLRQGFLSNRFAAGSLGGMITLSLAMTGALLAASLHGLASLAVGPDRDAGVYCNLMDRGGKVGPSGLRADAPR